MSPSNETPDFPTYELRTLVDVMNAVTPENIGRLHQTLGDWLAQIVVTNNILASAADQLGKQTPELSEITLTWVDDGIASTSTHVSLNGQEPLLNFHLTREPTVAVPIMALNKFQADLTMLNGLHDEAEYAMDRSEYGAVEATLEEMAEPLVNLLTFRLIVADLVKASTTARNAAS